MEREISVVDGDELDRPATSYNVPQYQVMFMGISIFIHTIDLGWDLWVALKYYLNGCELFCGLTLGFILVPAFINTALSILMYLDDRDSDAEAKRMTEPACLRLWVLLFPIAPMWRYLQVYKYADLCNNAEQRRDNAAQMKYYELMAKEDSDVALLRVIECFLESAPQQILQITILLSDHPLCGNERYLVKVLISISLSFISMAWSIAAYNRTIRIAQISKENISWQGTTVQMFWHLFVTTSRVVSIAVVMSIYPVYTCIAIFIHWFVITTCLALTEPWNFCNENTFTIKVKAAIYGAFSLVNIFTYISLVRQNTRWKYGFFYTVCLLENVVAMLIWYRSPDTSFASLDFFKPMICSLILILFFMGLVGMLLYYGVFHPKRRYSSCRNGVRHPQ